MPKQAKEDKRKETKSTRPKAGSSKNSKADKPAKSKSETPGSTIKTTSKKPASSKAATKSKTSKTARSSAAQKVEKSPKAAKAQPKSPTSAGKTAKASKTKTAAKAKVNKAAKPARKTKKTTSVVDEYSDTYSPKFLNEMKEMLLQMRKDLLEEVTRSVKSESDHLRFDVGDFYDHASNERDRELALTLSDRERDKLVLIEDALRSINDGTYGYCEMTGDKVGEARLRAMPFAKLSVEAQSELEKSGGS